jgi:hypothetical protein
LKSLETHFKPFQGVQATFKVILHFADVQEGHSAFDKDIQQLLDFAVQSVAYIL